MGPEFELWAWTARVASSTVRGQGLRQPNRAATNGD